jgi:hypothetical protein
MESVMPALESHADSLAMRALEASGGEMALRSLPYLRFNFRRDTSAFGRRHMWDRMTGDYRMEYQRGEDTTVVVLFNTQTRKGAAYLNGQPAPDSDALVDRAYGGFINDTYWLLMPTKMLDPGVSRELVPDSSDASSEVVRLTFDQVGLTPGDSYYVTVDRETGRVKRWHYVLQSGGEGIFTWEDWVELEGPKGAVILSGRKQGARSALLTDGLQAPESVSDDMFTDPMSRLGDA